MTTRDLVLENQRQWALRAKVPLDTRGYAVTYKANLRQPLSSRAAIAFEHGNGSETKDTKSRPAKMRALHSSSALAANVFDYWSDRDASPLLAALKLGSAQKGPIFEKKYPTGLEGTPPNLDVVICVDSWEDFAIESKFTEWLTPKSPSRKPFKEKYFEPVPDLWHRVGLHACQRLAIAVQAKKEVFRYLDVPQLLKHALGLAKKLDKQFALCYLYFDWPSRESDLHKKEIARFESAVGRELNFRCLTYQEVFGRLLKSRREIDANYLEYLRARYFQEYMSQGE